jgi:hypothetical protein
MLSYRASDMIGKIGPAFGPPAASPSDILVAVVIVLLIVSVFIATLGGVDLLLNRLFGRR